jgi:hypothetical protein
MAFNFDKGRPICKITGGKDNGKTVYYDDDETKTSVEDFEISDEGKFEPIPNTKSERDILYIAGPSGSGKSFFTRLYLLNYHKQYPARPILMFSKLSEDKSLEGIPMKRVMIDERLVTQPFDSADFYDSCVIMDDIDTIKDKEIRTALMQLKDQILETGRHHNISLILTTHLACKGNETRSALNESHQIVFFMSSGANYKYLLQNYLGMDTNQIKELNRMKSRWVSICRGFPQIIYTEKKLLFMKNLIKD